MFPNIDNLVNIRNRFETTALAGHVFNTVDSFSFSTLEGRMRLVAINPLDGTIQDTYDFRVADILSENLTPSTAVVHETTPKYSNEYGLINTLASAILPDGNLYQEHSYIVQTNVIINRWRDTVKALLHPAGTKLFSRIFVSDVDSTESVITLSDALSRQDNLLERTSNFQYPWPNRTFGSSAGILENQDENNNTRTNLSTDFGALYAQFQNSTLDEQRNISLDRSNIRGVWDVGLSYIIGDLVEFNSKFYRATTEIALGQATPDINNDWIEITAQLPARTDVIRASVDTMNFNSTTSYNIDDIVRDTTDGNFYIATQAHTASTDTPSATTGWNLITWTDRSTDPFYWYVGFAEHSQDISRTGLGTTNWFEYTTEANPSQPLDDEEVRFPKGNTPVRSTGSFIDLDGNGTIDRSLFPINIDASISDAPTSIVDNSQVGLTRGTVDFSLDNHINFTNTNISTDNGNAFWDYEPQGFIGTQSTQEEDTSFNPGSTLIESQPIILQGPTVTTTGGDVDRNTLFDGYDINNYKVRPQLADDYLTTTDTQSIQYNRFDDDEKAPFNAINQPAGVNNADTPIFRSAEIKQLQDSDLEIATDPNRTLTHTADGFTYTDIDAFDERWA